MNIITKDIMRYECYNKIGERVGVAYTKKEAEEIIKRANWEIDLIKDTTEYEQRVRKAQQIRQESERGTKIGLIAGLIFLIVGIIIALSNA